MLLAILALAAPKANIHAASLAVRAAPAAPREARSIGGLARQADLGFSLAAVAKGPGAEVRRLGDGSPAAAAGLRNGDVVLAFDGRALDGDIAIGDAIARARGGIDVKLEVARGTERRSLTFRPVPMPLERHDGIEVVHGSVTGARGQRLRTIFTRPEKASGRLPAVFFVGWLSCDSIEAPRGPSASDGMAQLIARLVTRSGWATFRVDKPGAGDSEGTCSACDFETELAGYRAAFRALAEDPRVDPARVVLVGMSNGGGFAPLVPDGRAAAGYVSIGGWGRTWYEHMLETDRIRAALSGKSPAELTRLMKATAELYTAYLIGKKAPGDVVRAAPSLASVWSEPPAHQYGRPAAFYQQLQDLNLAEAWEKVDARTLVLWGDQEFIMSRADAEAIAAAVNAKHPGRARFAVLPKTSHFLTVHGTIEQAFRFEPGAFAEEAASLVLAFLNETR
jgi:pimeloyl-ACP methyl ester carboxylesterase